MKKLLCRRKWKNKNKEDREGIQNGNFSERKIPLYCEEEKGKFIQIYYYTNDMEKNFKYFWTLKKKKKKHLRMQHYSVPKVSHSAKKQFNPSMGNHWTIKEKKNINIPDFSPVDFAFSPRRWWAIYRVAGGYLLFPTFLRVEGWALRRGVGAANGVCLF